LVDHLIIHLVRHAETIWHLEDKYAGHTEIELSKNGIDQSIKLKNWASTQNIDMIYTSALGRSIFTAKPSAESLSIIPMISSNLNEVNFGEIEGLTKNEFKTNFPNVWQDFQVSPATTLFPGGETGSSALTRSLKCILDILSKNESSEVMIISHGTLIRLLLTHFLSKDLNQYRNLFPAIDNIGITTISLEKSSSDAENFKDFKIYRYNSLY
jgi:probable phosphoglycerate mutase